MPHWCFPHSMRSRVNVTVKRHPPVCPIDWQQQWRPAGLLLSTLQAENIDRQLRAPCGRRWCSAANAGSIMLAVVQVNLGQLLVLYLHLIWKKPMCISVTPFHGPDAFTVTQPTVKDSEVNSKTLTPNSSLASLFHHLSPATNSSHKIRLSRGISNKFEASFTW